MHHTSFSSNENSPFSSPFQSPVSSPVSSRSASPTRLRRERSPQPSAGHVHLKRANSYRKHSRKGISKMDEMIRKRNNQMQRTRSQSDTDVATTTSTTANCSPEEEIADKTTTKEKRREKSVSGDYTDNCKTDRPTSTHSTYSERLSDNSRPGTPDRKKSLSQILDLRRLMELSPKLHRLHHKSSSNHSRTKSNHDADIDSDSPDSGPLFQATTMWVPGYDFKKKQQKPLEERPHSRSFLSRRGSKDKSLIALLGSSSPNLLRRGSKDKVEKQHIEYVKGKQRCERRDSSPLANSTNNNNNNNKTITKQTLRSCRSDSSSEILSVSERSAILAKKHQDFRDLKKPRNTEPEPPKGMLGRGKVKKISHTFEDGSIYVKPSLSNINSDQNTLSRSELRKLSGTGFENIVRTRAESFDSGEAFEKTTNRRRSYTVMTDFISMPSYSNSSSSSLIGERRGSESGYASPTESNDINTPPQINILSNEIAREHRDDDVTQKIYKESNWSDSRKQTNLSKGNFESSTKTTISESGDKDYLDVKLTNLCVTEL